MTVIDERIPLARITARASELNFLKTILLIIGGLFYFTGWAVGKSWFALMWCFAAVKVGFEESKAASTKRGG